MSMGYDEDDPRGAAYQKLMAMDHVRREGEVPKPLEEKHYAVLASRLQDGQRWLQERRSSALAARTSGMDRIELHFRGLIEHWRIVTYADQLRGLELDGFEVADEEVHWKLRHLAETRVRERP